MMDLCARATMLIVVSEALLPVSDRFGCHGTSTRETSAQHSSILLSDGRMVRDSTEQVVVSFSDGHHVVIRQ